jgi:hypothetical protein
MLDAGQATSGPATNIESLPFAKLHDKLVAPTLRTIDHVRYSLHGKWNDSTCTFGVRLGNNLEDVNPPHPVYMNTDDPFCMVAVGVQGSGKSHTLGTIIESCCMSCPPVTSKSPAMSALVMHYDQSEGNLCEAVAVGTRCAMPDAASARPAKVVVLASPSYLQQRREFYRSAGIEVIPLVFSWASLTAAQLRTLMLLKETDSQLYVGVMLSYLRSLQRENRIPSFPEFQKAISKTIKSVSQSGPLQQRLTVLEGFVAESNLNSGYSPMDLKSLVQSGVVVVADLTDPMLSAQEANGIFQVCRCSHVCGRGTCWTLIRTPGQVLLEQYRSIPTEVAKLVVLDEAHKYLTENDPLSRSVVSIVRQMRHLGIRVAISTQSPLVLPAELLELVSVAVVHRFHSQDWFKYLSSKVPLPQTAFPIVCSLTPGQCLVFSTSQDAQLHRQNREMRQAAVVESEFDDDSGAAMVRLGGSDASDNVVLLRVRPRLTLDLGRSIRNVGVSK